MILKKSFEELLANKINLNQTRIDNAIRAHGGVREYLKNHTNIKQFYLDSYLQGSYAQKTAIKPFNGNDYDVDVVLSMNWKDEYGNFKDTTKLKQLIYLALEDNKTYKEKLKSHHGKKCISLEYTDFHLDILPVHFDNNGDNIINIIDKQNRWRESNPKDFSKWCININKNTNNIFKKIVRIMKYWRNLQFGEHHTPKSIVLSTIIGNNIPMYNISIDKTLVETIEKVANIYQESDFKVPIIVNPSLITENLARNWKFDDYTRFTKKIKKAAETARKALDEEKDVQKSINLWNSSELFAGNLPNSSLSIQEEIDNALMIKDKQKSETLYIGSTGLVNVGVKDRVGTASGKNVRTFGGNE